MSAYSTISISRSTAKKKLIEHLMIDVSDERLESFLDDVLRDRLYNAQIVNDGEKNEDFLLD
jgi:hypothetical protein